MSAGEKPHDAAPVGINPEFLGLRPNRPDRLLRILQRNHRAPLRKPMLQYKRRDATFFKPPGNVMSPPARCTKPRSLRPDKP